METAPFPSAARMSTRCCRVALQRFLDQLANHLPHGIAVTVLHRQTDRVRQARALCGRPRRDDARAGFGDTCSARLPCTTCHHPARSLLHLCPPILLNVTGTPTAATRSLRLSTEWRLFRHRISAILAGRRRTLGSQAPISMRRRGPGTHEIPPPPHGIDNPGRAPPPLQQQNACQETSLCGGRQLRR